MAETIEDPRFQRVVIASALWPVCLLFIPLVIPVCTGRVLTYDDLSNFHLPLRMLYSAALSSGHSLLWTPALSGGFYVLAEGQVGALHPVHYVLYRCFSLTTAFNLELILSYLVGFGGMWAFLHRRGVVTAACILGAMTFAFCGFSLLHLTHMNAIAVVSHIPWLLYAIERAVAGPGRRPVAECAFVSLLVGSQLLLGYPQYVWLSGLICGIYALMRARELMAMRKLIPIAGAALAGALIGAAQLLPTIDLLERSVRAAVSREFQLSFSLHPFNLLQLWIPYVFPTRVYARPEEMFVHEFGVYDGALCTIAVFWCGARWTGLRSRSLATFAVCLSFVGLLLALGRFGLLYGALTYLPVIGGFRAPARYVLFLHVGLAILLALTFDDLLRSRRQAGRLVGVVAIPVLLGVALTACAWLGVFAPAIADVAPPGPLLLGAALMVAAGVLVLLAAVGNRTALLLIPLFAAVDLGFWGYSYIWGSPPLAINQLIEQADSPPAASPGTLVHIPTSDLQRNRILLRGYKLFRPYLGLPPARALSEDKVTTLRLAGVEWVREAAGWTAVPQPMRRVRILSNAQVSTDPARDLDAIDISRTALVSLPSPQLDADAHGRVEVVTDEPGRLEVDVMISGRAILATTESYHEGWRARTGDESLSVLPLYGDHLGVVLKPGNYRAHIEFRPDSSTHGILVSILGLAIVLVIAAVLWRSGSKNNLPERESVR